MVNIKTKLLIKGSIHLIFYGVLVSTFSFLFVNKIISDLLFFVLIVLMTTIITVDSHILLEELKDE